MGNQNLIFMSFANQVAAYDALNTLSGSLKILEFGSHHNQQVVLLAGTSDNPLKNFKGPVADSLYLENPTAELLKAYFHQQNVKVKSHLLVLECKQMSSLLNACAQLLKNTKFEIVDITKGGDTYPYATAFLANDGASDIAPHIPHDLVFKLIAQPSSEVLSLFNS
jgi:hypothetical protein